MSSLTRPNKQYIGGSWRDGSSHTVELSLTRQ